MRGFEINDGSRPSRLELGRRYVGEVDSRGGEAERRFAEEVEESRGKVAAFDFEVLRAAAVRLDDEKAVARPVRQRRWWFGFAVALAAVLLTVVPSRETNRLKGSVEMEVFTERGGEVVQVEWGAPLTEGDEVRFALTGQGHERVVVVSIDEAGVETLLWPEEVNEEPTLLSGEARSLLPGAVQLDDVIGGEMFVAVFDPSDTVEALELIREAFEDGGLDGVLRLRDEDPAVALWLVEKR